MSPPDAYEFAWLNARRNSDGSVVEADLVALIAQSVDLDVDEARAGLARRIVARRKRPGQTAPDGMVALPGLDLYPYEPGRLIVDDGGNLVENQSAPIKFKVAEARRARDGARRAFDRAEREQSEADQFAVWAAEQLEAGRAPREVTWGNCVKETFAWKDVAPAHLAAEESGDDAWLGDLA